MDLETEGAMLAAETAKLAARIGALMDALDSDHPALDALEHVAHLLDASGDYLSRLPSQVAP
jgi:hypothetical protein